jgi:hypothetical protein
MGNTTIKNIHSSASVEWYTPPQHILAVRAALGGVITLDPASCVEANVGVCATTYFTKEDDGLTQPWVADSVFCNPPYGRVAGRSSQGMWAEKFLSEYAAGNFRAGVLLTNAGIGDAWFRQLTVHWQCQCYRRIRFVGAGSGPTKGNALTYVGPDPARFASALHSLGRVIAPPNPLTTGEPF